MIRPVAPGDREAYLAMAHDFYHSEAVLHPVPDVHFERTFEEMLRSDAYVLGFIFEWEGEYAGYALLSKTYSQEAGGPAVWIEEIYVMPAFRNRGLGHAFFAQLEELAPAARYRLEIEPDNERAERLYRSMGFEPLGYGQLVRDL